ncbi:hypothetical protein PNOK_0469600 [Pyrrhoderma noxium]|uniref:Uncharacterized protein n=1 Tax=Pyrrhoderma noxium TaxID=2282107 RepID=A0A286UJK3_9AGAM|nr:hypothetical protein PNOK_0469600 [Pyrrhoderma noxium]
MSSPSTSNTDNNKTPTKSSRDTRLTQINNVVRKATQVTSEQPSSTGRLVGALARKLKGVQTPAPSTTTTATTPTSGTGTN